MLSQYRKYERDEFFVVGVDTADGGNDRVAAHFLSQSRLDVPTVLHSEMSITACTPIIFRELERVHSETGIAPVVAYENQNGGIFELQRLSRLNRNNKFRIYKTKKFGKEDTKNNPESDGIGWNTSTASRPKMLQELQEAIDNKLIRLYHPETVNELFTFIINKQGKPEAEDNSHDDLVMSLAIAYQLYQTEKPVRPSQHYQLPVHKPSDSVIGI